MPLKALGWLLRGDSPVKFRPRMDPLQWLGLTSFLGACRSSVNHTNSQHLLRLAALSQQTLESWHHEDKLKGFNWQRNGKLLTFRSSESFA